MPSQLINRINIDAGVDTNKIAQYYDEAKSLVDAKKWSPNEARYMMFCHRYAYRKALIDGCKRLQSGEEDNNEGARSSRALQALIKATLSEIEAEKSGIHL